MLSIVVVSQGDVRWFRLSLVPLSRPPAAGGFGIPLKLGGAEF